jgi:competence protein ComEC
MLGAVAYTIFSGAEVATVRSCLMTLIMLGAVLFDRPALSMRNLALAALVVLAREPETLLGPSFQMSFAAVAALIACAEWLRLRPRAEAPPLGLLGRVWRTLWLAALGLVTTSVLASLATGPFGAYHFQTVNPFGLIGNLLALPFVSLVVMPAAVVGAALYPLGLDAVAWWIMGLATEPVIWVSRNVAAFAGAVTVVPAFSPLALLLVAAGVVVLTVLTTVLRVFGAAPLLAGAVLAAQPTRTDIVIDRNGSGAMVRSATGALTLMGQPSAFVVEQWLRADGDARRPNDPSLRTGTACDSRGCVATTASGRTVAFSRDPSAIAEDCDRATLVVTPLRWRGACKALMVDRGTLDDFGSIAIVDGPGGLSAATSRDPARPKPWHPRPTPRTPSSAMPDAPTLPESHEAPLQ